MTDDERRIFANFEWSIRALAQPAAIQRSLFPAFVCVADELALEFEECLREVTARGALLPAHATSAVESLDAQFVSMSGPEHPDLWADEFLAFKPEWEEVRRIALAVLTSMGWSATSPGSSARMYVGAPKYDGRR